VGFAFTLTLTFTFTLALPPSRRKVAAAGPSCTWRDARWLLRLLAGIRAVSDRAQWQLSAEGVRLCVCDGRVRLQVTVPPSGVAHLRPVGDVGAVGRTMLDGLRKAVALVGRGRVRFTLLADGSLRVGDEDGTTECTLREAADCATPLSVPPLVPGDRLRARVPADDLAEAVKDLHYVGKVVHVAVDGNRGCLALSVDGLWASVVAEWCAHVGGSGVRRVAVKVADLQRGCACASAAEHASVEVPAAEGPLVVRFVHAQAHVVTVWITRHCAD